jgi:hypothetical protein
MNSQFIANRGMANHTGLIPAKAGIHVQQPWDLKPGVDAGLRQHEAGEKA